MSAINKIKVSKGLQRIRFRRYICLTIIFGFLPICVLLAGLGIQFLISGALILFIFGLFMQHRLNKSRCPKCGQLFFVQQFDKHHYHPTSSLSFPPERNCQHCGLDLYTCD